MNKTPSTKAALALVLGEMRRRIEPAFSAETAAQGFSGKGPATGQCAATALLVNAALGGRFVSARVNGYSHWFNRFELPNGPVDADITGDQFGYPVLSMAPASSLYEGSRVRQAIEVQPETIRRAVLLAERARLRSEAQRLREWLARLGEGEVGRGS